MENSKTAFEQQQSLAELYGINGSIISDLYTAKTGAFGGSEKSALSEKIKYLFPDQVPDKKLENFRNIIVESVWNQRKYNGGNLLMSIVFVLHCPDTFEPLSSAASSKIYSIHPIFKIRKCRQEISNKNCCTVFVDEFGRVYENWFDFINKNKMPEGILIAPKFGLYRFDENKKVLLQYLWSPASCGPQIALKVGDYSAAALGIGAVCALPLVLFPPLAVTAAIVGSVAGGIAGGWAIGRSSAHIVDRSYHEESIGLGNSESRSAWLNITAGTVGLGAMGLTTRITTMAAAGKAIPTALQRTTIALNGLTLATSGLGVSSSIYDIVTKYKDDEKITSWDIVQLSSSLFLFTHSMYNLHTAIKIMNSNQNQTFGNFRRLLGLEIDNNKLFNATSRYLPKGYIGSSVFDKIRPLTLKPDKKYTYDIYEKMEQIMANGNYNQKNLKDIENAYMIEIGAPDTPLIKESESQIDNNTFDFIIDIAFNLMQFYVGNPIDMIDKICKIAEQVSRKVLLIIIDSAQQFTVEIICSLQKKLNIKIPFEYILWDFFQIARSFVQDKFTIQFLMSNLSKIIEKCSKLYKNMFNSPNEYKCNTCGGVYSITQ